MTFAAGIILGAMPFAKLQSTPLGVVIGISGLLVLWFLQIAPEKPAEGLCDLCGGCHGCSAFLFCHDKSNRVFRAYA